VSGEAVLEVKNLCVELRGENSTRKLLEDLNFFARQGEVLGILGQSGSGKSLTALALSGLLPKTMYASGSVKIRGKEIIGAGERALNTVRGGEVSIVFQEPSAALDPLMRIGKQIALPLKKHASPRGAHLWDAVFLLMREVKLTDVERIAHSYPHEISGGQRQRAALAIALACSPCLLIADEPTSSIDAHMQKQLVKLIADVAHNRGITVLFISHDIAVVNSIAQRIIVMKDGKIVEEAPAHELLVSARHEYSRLLIQSARTLDGALKRIVDG
jgi:ABC-type dipeptide/oligopeptide/nickel transport system ATPase component